MSGIVGEDRLASVSCPWRLPALVLAAVLTALLATLAAGACLDIVAAVRSPLALDYGEGIVWQQAALIPGPRMYGLGQDLPFIVFHYPPLYHLLVRAMGLVQPDLLAAGRAVAGLSTLLLAPLAAALVLEAARQPDRRPGSPELWAACIAALLVLCVHAVRTWGLAMRVDMPGIALSLAGLLAGIRAEGRFRGTAVALLLCTAAVFTKQTLVSAGIAVFVAAALRNPRAAMAAAAAAGGCGVALAGLLQWWTGGGFFTHILGYNINRFTMEAFQISIRQEWSSLPVALLAVISVPKVLATVRPALRTRLAAMDRSTGARMTMLLHVALCTVLLPMAFKSGSYFNYFLEWLCSACVLIGMCLSDLARTAPPGRRLALAALLGLLSCAALAPMRRQLPDRPDADDLREQAALVQLVKSIPQPVASEDMTVLMQAGRQVWFEPAIATELAAAGRWDEAPLLAMIRAHGFGAMLTSSDPADEDRRRSPGLAAAMRDAYPQVRQVGRRMWLSLPGP